MLESNRDYSAGDRSARPLLSCHAGPEPAGQSEGRILVEMEIIAERVQNRLRTVIPGEILLHGNIASGFHRFPFAERAKNEPEPPNVKPASPSSPKARLPRQPKSVKSSGVSNR